MIPMHLMLVLKNMQPIYIHSQKSRKSPKFLHVKSKTRITCWNVRTLGSLSDQSAKLLATIDTMTKRIELLALSESRWYGHGIVSICSTILYSGPSNGVAIAILPCNLLLAALGKLLVVCSTLSLNESYASSSNVTSPTSLLSSFMPLPTHLPVQHKLQPLLIHSMISCSLWSLTFHLETCCWF